MCSRLGLVRNLLGWLSGLWVLGLGCGARSLHVPGSDGGVESEAAPRRDQLGVVDQDRAPDRATSATPCAAAARLEQSIDQSMAVCRIAETSGWVSQCGAAALCGLGWHLCRPAEYQGRFGPAAGPPGVETTWLGGCVLSEGVPHLPTQTICADCSLDIATLVMVGWGCSKDTALSVQGHHAAIVSHPECYRIGKDVEATAAFWAPIRPGYLLRQAFCCRD